jgi:hypothetical protein
MSAYLDAFARPGAPKPSAPKPTIKELKADIATQLQKAKDLQKVAVAAEQKATQAARDPNYRFNDRENYDAQYGKGAFDGKPPVPESTKVGPSLKVEPVPTTPTTPAAATVAQAVSKTVKTAPIDTVLFNDDSVPIEVMADLIFENIGGHELINIARNDIVNGQKVSYQPIKNLSSIQQQYNYNNILGIQNTSDKYFSNFSIKLENKIPSLGGGPNGSNVYLDTATGNLIIETINMDNDEQVEIEITLGGIIYEAEFGEIDS